MKRILAIILAFILVFSFCSCAQKPEQVEEISPNELLSKEAVKENTSEKSESENSVFLSSSQKESAAESSSAVKSSSAESSSEASSSLASASKSSAVSSASQSKAPEKEEKVYYCTISIECSTILNNLSKLAAGKEELIPEDGFILYPVEVEFEKGETVFDVLKTVCSDYGILMESSWSPMYNSAYIEGINNIYEKDCGSLSGWQYKVNGWSPNYGCSSYELEGGEYIEWCYTCNLGNDI